MKTRNRIVTIASYSKFTYIWIFLKNPSSERGTDALSGASVSSMDVYGTPGLPYHNKTYHWAFWRHWEPLFLKQTKGLTKRMNVIIYIKTLATIAITMMKLKRTITWKSHWLWLYSGLQVPFDPKIGHFKGPIFFEK